MINVKLMFLLTFLVISIAYFLFLPIPKIINIIIDEYIAILAIVILFIVYKIYQFKLQNRLLYEFIKDINHIPIKQTLFIFILFQCYDYYNEQGFIGMISLWFMYWVYGICADLLMHIINLHKNYTAYKKADLI